MSGMDMGGMSSGNGIPTLFDFQQYYWAVVGAAIAIAAVVNVLDRFLAYQRLCDKSSTPSKPKSIFFSTYATITATAREVANTTLRPIALGNCTLRLAPLGPVSLVLANLVTIIVMMFYGFDTLDNYSWENIGYRAGYMTICQLPLVILLAGKQNIIGLLTGTSYERLSWYHQWISRTLWLSATIHMGFWFRDYAQYDYIVTMLQTDSLTRHGFAAWCVLTFILLASFAPLRKWNYEFFVIQHIVTTAGFLAAVYLHAPSEVKIWVWIPIGLVCFDRFARILVLAFANLSIIHLFSEKKKGPLFANKATFTPLPGNVSYISIPNPVIDWKPGQHVFLACHLIAPLQSHPFTIMSLPCDGRLDFFVRAERGGSRRFFQYASKQNSSLGETQPSLKNETTVFIEGPYGNIRPLHQFDSVVFFAGGMGCTYTMPLMRDIVHRWKRECEDSSSTVSRVPKMPSLRLAVTKRVRFVWVIKSRSQLSWLETQFKAVLEDVRLCGQLSPTFNKEIQISIYLTCDETLEKDAATRTILGIHDRTSHTRIVPEKKEMHEKVHESETLFERSFYSSSESTDVIQEANCGPSYTCCCTATIKDETEISSSTAKCNCSGPAAAVDNTSQSPSLLSLHNSNKFNTKTGRPHPRTIIRSALERAEGESAVVVCGPQGLATDVRQSVVSLSDERAIHKGTGAQGVYLHIENFGW
ncbi:putative metalloreductase [Talaromyces proteolyticus]|uniref:ferric-chelate reductase (NADPH) n=1 Tax=Talaromyces proteolyticus TaxID=1131652 RepID=A0AAD4KED3_9EURO|nr:putative metalloreductase [Talaromyces proteolyticus]KAH8688812.1 putative metalloreductase [Talaromyces proteolyticus]